MKLYVTRHGQVQWNAEGRLCGRTDLELTDLGRQQAEELADSLKDIKIDLIISSPLKRTLATGQAVASRYGIPIIKDDRLIEQSFGIYEGMDRKDPEYLFHKKNFPMRNPNGESAMQVAFRVYGFLNDIKRDYGDKTVLLVTHGGVFRVINAYFNSLTNEEYFIFSPENCRLEEYEL